MLGVSPYFNISMFKKPNAIGTVLISGGARGIGEACALKLAKLGYDIAFTWSSSKNQAIAVEKKIKRMGRNCTSIELHLESDNIEEKFQEIDKKISSPLVGLVNNAAIDGGRGSFLEKKYSDWLHIFQVNVFGLMELSREAYKRMAVSKGGSGGSIVNISSQVATFGSNKLLAYSSSKGAVNSFTIALAKEIGHEQIRVNCVSPGLIDTNKDASVVELHQSRVGQIPLQRLGTPEDVSDVVAWLITSDSSFVSGTIIPVHGGR
jgi:NAD(P)-dependent dehydrogenase (short-subunit alcohol dehydrogenase family)